MARSLKASVPALRQMDHYKYARRMDRYVHFPGEPCIPTDGGTTVVSNRLCIVYLTPRQMMRRPMVAFNSAIRLTSRVKGYPQVYQKLICFSRSAAPERPATPPWSRKRPRMTLQR